MNSFTGMIVAYLTAIVVFAVCDLSWVGVIAQSFYRAQVGHLMSSTVQWLPVVLFYLLYLAGLCHFVIFPAIAEKSFLHAIVRGAFFGLVVYGTYDLTNWATLRDWPIPVTFVDMAWGTFAASFASGVVYQIARFFHL